MLVLLPLLGVGFVFAVMWYLYRDWERSLVRRHQPEVRDAAELPQGSVEMETVGGVGHTATEDLYLVRKDRSGRTESVFVADRVVHFDKTSADIYRPHIEFYTAGGEVITLLAERAHVKTRGALTDIEDIESGRLWGNVVLEHDNGTPDDYTDDILVGLDEVTFDNQAQEIATDGSVVMAGGDMTLTATKMRMALDRETRRINTVTFLEDILITFEAGESMRLSLTAPAADSPAAEDGGASPASPELTPVRAETEGETSSGTAADAEDSTDVWRIDLAGDVDARQDVQRLRCEHLTLYNRSQGPMPGTADESDEAGAAAAAAKADASAAPPEDQDGEAAANVEPLMTIVADGPLIITPVDDAERRTLGDRQYEVAATGAPVVVEDGDTTILGDTVRYNTRNGSGTVVGEASPMRLQQPEQILLTGGRLDFDRGAATAEVTGEGRLLAHVRTAGLTGAASSSADRSADAPSAAESGAASAGADETSEDDLLDATWRKGLRLVFYRLPEEASQGLGEIRQANFRGRAVVKQADGLLKGDDLTIDFFPAEGDEGQAVQRLVGHGDVFLKNAPVGGTGADDAAQVGDIAAEDLDIRFARDPDGGARPAQLDAAGNVAINDPEGKIRAEQLAVTFGVSEEGDTEARFLEARGNVLIDREDLRAEGDHVRRDTAAGTLLLEGKPARARRGESRIVGPSIRFSREDGRATVVGAGELEVPATTDLRGRPRAEPEPLLVTWTRDMHFADQRNFARFDGDVTARTGGTDLACRRLWVHFADAPEPPETPETAAAAVPAAPADATGEKTDEESTAGEGLQNLFGRKRLVRVLAENDVTAVDQRLEEGEAIRHRMEITGGNLTYLEESRKAYMHGPGRLRILARERDEPDAAPPRPVTPETATDAWKGQVPDGYARTAVTWTESMAYDGQSSQGYFQGGVVAAHTGRGVPGEQGGSRREPTNTRINSRDLQIVFGERPGPAEPTEPEVPQEERMQVEKLIARGDVLLWIDDRRGSAERLIYQRQPELIRLYRGPEPNAWARLWQQNEATQQFGQIAARTITYDPNTGRIDVVDQQIITMSPEPEPLPREPPRLVPGPTN
jgi:lipopolysaccharide export system protein LptC